MKRCRSRPLVGMLLTLPLLAGCLPTIQRQWDVQPVTGQVVDGQTGEAVALALVTNLANPAIHATTNRQGEFYIAGQSHLGFHMAMPASSMERQQWRIVHSDYGDAIAETRTLFPPLSRQLKKPVIPLFPLRVASPASCPDYHYLQQLVQWQTIRGTPQQELPTSTCHDPDLVKALYNKKISTTQSQAR